MAQAIISRRGGGSGYATITFNGVSALKKTNAAALFRLRESLASTTVGNYALLGGGRFNISGQYFFWDTVNSYDINLIKSSPANLSKGRSRLAATTVGNYALFGGGYGSSYLSTVDAYDTSLTRSIPPSLDGERGALAATTVGNYALFGGGGDNHDQSSTVDAYYVNNKVQVYPGTKYKLGSMSSESTSSTMKEIETTAPITGYIKIKDATIN